MKQNQFLLNFCTYEVTANKLSVSTFLNLSMVVIFMLIFTSIEQLIGKQSVLDVLLSHLSLIFFHFSEVSNAWF